MEQPVYNSTPFDRGLHLIERLKAHHLNRLNGKANHKIAVCLRLDGDKGRSSNQKKSIGLPRRSMPR
jgi:hypothetical protein